jgi:hypothetical protein
MGTRFNVLMTVQIPLQQKPKPKCTVYTRREGCCPPRAQVRRASAPPKTGRYNAARVSRGSAVDETRWTGVKNTEPKRDPNQHITVTVLLYNTVAGGVPSAEDVHAAIEDMERLYAACAWSDKLADKGADFMKSELTISEGADIAQKVAKQPPKCGLVDNASVSTYYAMNHETGSCFGGFQN